MATYNYILDNFVATPSGETMLRIYDQNGTLRYSCDPNLAYFFYKNNLVIIKADNREDITLDFENVETAISALESLNNAKKTLIAYAGSNTDYYTKDEIDQGILDDQYVTLVKADGSFALTSHTHTLTGLTDVQIIPVNGQVLTYDQGIWVLSAFTFDVSAFTSNYYTMVALETSGLSHIHWGNLTNLPTTLSGYGIQGTEFDALYYSTSGSVTPHLPLNPSAAGQGYGELDDRYYTQNWINTYYALKDNVYTRNDLLPTGNTASVLEFRFMTLSGSTGITGHLIPNGLWNLGSLAQPWQELYLSGHTLYLNGVPISVSDTGQLQVSGVTVPDVNVLLTSYSPTSHTHAFADLTSSAHTHQFGDLGATAHTHAWTEISTAHTHDERYYTQAELTGGTLDSRYYNQTQLDGGQLDSRYYTSATTNELLGLYALTSHTHNSDYYTQTYINTYYYTKNQLNGGQLDNRYYTTAQTYTQVQIANLLLAYYTSAQTETKLGAYYLSTQMDTILLGYYTSAQTDQFLALRALSTHTHTWAEISTAHTHDERYYTQTQSNDLLNLRATTGHTHAFSTLTNTAHTHTWAEISTAHTHDERYYTRGELTGGTLDSRYYTQNQLNGGQLDTRYYTSAYTANLLLRYALTSHTHADYATYTWLTTYYYTSAQTEVILNDYYPQTYVDQYLYTSAQTEGRLLSYYPATTTDNLLALRSYTSHTHSEYLNLAGLDARYISLSGSTGITGSLIPVASDTYDLGSPDHLWRELHIGGNTIYIDHYPVKVTTGSTFSGPRLKVSSAITSDEDFNVPVFSDLLAYAITSHTHASLSNTAHTHDERYYMILGGQDQTLPLNPLGPFTGTTDQGYGELDDRYYTKSWIETYYALKDSVYTSAQTNVMFSGYYTSAQTNVLLGLRSSTAHTHAFSALTNTAHTHQWTEITNTPTTLVGYGISAVYYTTAQTQTILGSYYTSAATLNLLNSYAVTSHTHRLGDLSGVTLTNPSNTQHLVYQGGFWINQTSAHTHDYYSTSGSVTPTLPLNPLGPFTGTTDQGYGYLDNRYYTQNWINTYYASMAYVNQLLSAITFSGSGAIYYTTTQVDQLLTHYNTTAHTHRLGELSGVTLASPTQNQILLYSAGTWVNATNNALVDLTPYYTSAQTIALLIPYYTSAQTNTLLGLRASTAHTHAFSALTNTAHTHQWAEITNTPTTLAGYGIGDAYTQSQSNTLYYTQTYINTYYYTQVQANANFLSANTSFYTTAATQQLLLGYWATAETFEKSLTGLTDVDFINPLASGQTMVFYAGQWVNTAVTLDLSAYWDSAYTWGLISAIQTGVTRLDQLTDTGIGSPTNGQGLVWDTGLSKWVNSGISVNLAPYYTSAQTQVLFYTSAYTNQYFSATGHSHALSGLTDISGLTPTNGQFLRYSTADALWYPADSSWSGTYVPLSGGTMTGALRFDFMSGTTLSGTTGWLLYADSGGTVQKGSDIVALYVEDNNLLNALVVEGNWSGSTFTASTSAYTVYDGQRYIDVNYFYEYMDGTLYRSYFASGNHNHDDRYYTKDELHIDGVLDDRYLRSAATYNLSYLGDVSLTSATLATGSIYLQYNFVNGLWENVNYHWEQYAHSANTVSTGTTVYGISGLTGGGNLSQNLYVQHATAATLAYEVGTTTSVGLVGVTLDIYGHLTKCYTYDFDLRYLRLVNNKLSGLTDVSITNPTSYQILSYSGGTWNNRTLVKTDLSDWLETDYVHTSGNEGIYGIKTFNSDLYTLGSLYVGKTATTYALFVQDKLIQLHTSANTATTMGVSGITGLEIHRGVYPNYFLVYDEGTSAITSGGTIRMGIRNNLRSVATLQDNPVDQAVAVWNNTTKLFQTFTGLTWDGDSLMIEGDLNVRHNMYVTGVTIITGETYILGDYHISGNSYVTGFVSAQTYYGDGSHLTGLMFVGGNDQSIQFNSGGTLTGNSYLTYNYNTHSVVLGGTGITASSGHTVYMPQAEMVYPGGGVILTSPNGTRYLVAIDDLGNLTSKPA